MSFRLQQVYANDIAEYHKKSESSKVSEERLQFLNLSLLTKIQSVDYQENAVSLFSLGILVFPDQESRHYSQAPPRNDDMPHLNLLDSAKVPSLASEKQSKSADSTLN